MAAAIGIEGEDMMGERNQGPDLSKPESGRSKQRQDLKEKTRRKEAQTGQGQQRGEVSVWAWPSNRSSTMESMPELRLLLKALSNSSSRFPGLTGIG